MNSLPGNCVIWDMIADAVSSTAEPMGTLMLWACRESISSANGSSGFALRTL